MRKHFAFGILACGLAAASASAGLIDTQFEGATPAVYSNGAGTGFGGTLGNGSITMDVVGSDLVIGFIPGGNVDNIVGVFLDTKAGGHTDATMDDQGDGSRRVLSNVTRDLNDVFPILPDFGVTFGNFGSPASVVFELVSGGSLNFISFSNTGYSATIPLATLGNPTQVDFFAVYVSDTAYNSNESLPFSDPLQGLGGNPGFGDGQFGAVNPPPNEIVYENFNRFVIPEPTTLAALAGLSLLGLRRR